MAQLLTLMDGLSRAARSPSSAPPTCRIWSIRRLRRPGRFDREIAVNAPSPVRPLQILQIHSRGFPMADDVDLDRLAEITHGFVGADLEVLCKEAGMLALRELIDEAGMETIDLEELAESAQDPLAPLL